MRTTQLDREQKNEEADSLAAVQAELQRQPHILLKLAENSLTVAKSLRDNYFKNTAHFVSDVRRAIHHAQEGTRPDPILDASDVSSTEWADFQGEVVSFIDGGVGRVQISSQVPILLRVGSYCVKVGERQLAERETFGYYPVVLGDLQGGSKDRKDFVDIVRITAELLGGLSALMRTPTLRVLMFHGPLVYLVGNYAGHTPFTEGDIDLFLQHYTPGDGKELKEEFLREARLSIYPQMIPDRSDDWANRRVFEPLAWIAFLYRKLVQEAKRRSPVPVIAGVVERGELREFSERVLLDRIFRGLRAKGNQDHFNRLFGRTDLNSPGAFLERLGYTDTLLLAMILRPGLRSEEWSVAKYEGLRAGNVALPGESFSTEVTFASYAWADRLPGRVRLLRPRVGDNRADPRRGLFRSRRDSRSRKPRGGPTCTRGYCRATVSLLAWTSSTSTPMCRPGSRSAYGKLIRFHLGVSLQRGEINDAEMQRLLVQAIYMTHRDWLFRPQA